ncbi:hypothetical protein QNH28_21030 [Paenibacillus sp. G2S3]|uniref:hypothetical protein n=1 Tax=Paenibacillus sp. G2S3 TaxID=3047872 RepID=UPI0024C1BE21|nr:hypothetical protein [Paenibacillus sp. G2S3]WHY17964.1 hypothetical protein QNH28_21030 [Paenibacillus sp. G2S3]
MIDFILFIIFSGLETYAIFFLAFKIFKIDLYHKEMVFASFIMGFFSYSLRTNYDLFQLDILSQYALMFCFMWLLFRIHPFYASILTGMAYQSYSVIQTSLYYILKFIAKLPLTLLDYISINVFILQFLSALTVICIGVYVGNRRIGFDFVPDKPDVKIKTTTSEKILFILNLPALTIVTSLSYFVESFFFFLIPIFYGIILWGYLYFSYKKDRNNYESFST